eukprot:COSAG06_NODE_671_length_13206_cov_477.269474_7_plen_122_part_00
MRPRPRGRTAALVRNFQVLSIRQLIFGSASEGRFLAAAREGGAHTHANTHPPPPPCSPAATMRMVFPPTHLANFSFSFFFLFFLFFPTVDRSAWTRYRGVWGRRQPVIHLAEKNGRLDSSP